MTNLLSKDKFAAKTNSQIGPEFLMQVKEIGYSVVEKGRLVYEASKTRGTQKLEIEGMHHYFAMIQDYLFSEEEIIKILRRTEDRIQDEDKDQKLRVELMIEQKFGRL